jgi:hypothetical protein
MSAKSPKSLRPFSPLRAALYSPLALILFISVGLGNFAVCVYLAPQVKAGEASIFELFGSIIIFLLCHYNVSCWIKHHKRTKGSKDK